MIKTLQTFRAIEHRNYSIVLHFLLEYPSATVVDITPLIIQENLRLLSKRLVPPLSITLLLWLLSWRFPTQLNYWLGQLSWLALITPLLTALLCLQFGRSRLAICALLLVLANIATPSLLATLGVTFDRFILLLIVLVSYLIWQQDKGARPLNALFTLGQLLLLAIACAWLVAFLTPLLEAKLNATWLSWYQATPFLASHFTVTEALLSAFALLLCLLRALLLPTNTHVTMQATVIGLLLLFLWPSTQLNILIAIALTLLFLLAVLTDSFTMAFRDELTGIPSRRALQQYVQTLGRKYVVIMADIDHFKKFNDTHGHDVGDQVLKLVASKLAKVTGGGKAFRYGGEEFTIVFVGKTIEQVQPHVQELCDIIANYPVVLRSQNRPAKAPKKDQKPKVSQAKTVKVTCSFGIAARNNKQQHFDGVMKSADTALYAAKKAGRNCVKASS